MPSPAPPPDQVVTSSDLVRHFGLWQERAARAPLYILHRGRPRFVLVSIETMDALCAAHDADAAQGGIDSAVLLDAVGDLVLVTDADLRIVATSRSARAHFGGVAAVGARLGGVAPLAMRPLLADMVERVVAGGVVEHLELASPVRAGRLLAVTIVPVGRGVALVARDGGGEREQARTRATAHAATQAMAAAGSVAAVTLSPRGYIVDPGPALAALTGLTCESLDTLRFVILSEIGGRVALGDALERVLADGATEAVDCKLLVNRAAPLPVRIGIAPIRTGVAIDGASAVVTVRGRPA